MAGKKNKTNKYWNFRLKMGAVLLCVFLVIGFIMPVFCKVSPVEWQSYSRNMDPTAEHWLGTTGLGQDVFWLLAYSVLHSLLRLSVFSWDCWQVSRADGQTASLPF